MLLACHLLRGSGSDLDVTLIEKRPDVGRGIAYYTANPDHLLNVRAANMSAFPDQPDHFGVGSAHDRTTAKCPGSHATILSVSLPAEFTATISPA